MHEIKHDGYRLIVRREGAAVRLFTRRGYELDRPLSRDRQGGPAFCGRPTARSSHYHLIK